MGETFDVCVIGTGAGGGVMIQELTESGFGVVALQRGPLLTTTDFLNNDELEIVIRDTLFSPDQVETWRPDESTPAIKGRFNYMAHCVGGTMTHWAAWAWRYRPDDFKALAREGPVAGASLADWPYDYAELAPWYDKAERDFGVAGDAKANPFGAPRKTDYPLPAHPSRTSGQLFSAGARKLGYAPFPVPMAINSHEYGGRSACMYGGACQQYGCPINAKATSFSVCIPRARATRKLDLRPNAMAFEITVGEDGRARSVRYLDEHRREHEVFARHVVVSGNAIGTPHLLLSSKSAKFPDGLANSSGLVGRNLTYHTFSYVAYLADRPTHQFMGLESHAAIDDLHVSDARRGFIRGGVVADMNMASKQPIAHALVANGGHPTAKRGWGADYKSFLQGFPRAGGIIGILEDLPIEANRVDLDPDVKDAYGLSAPRITHRQHPNDVAMRDWYAERQLEIARAAGAVESWIVQGPDFSFTKDPKTSMRGSAHFHGTCRMGDVPSRSVVDRWCRAHDVPNLWIVDGSVFPTAGGYNPTLTILANAYRVADHFVRAAKRMDTGA